MSQQYLTEPEADDTHRPDMPDMARLFFRACLQKTGRAWLVWTAILNFAASQCAVISVMALCYGFVLEADPQADHIAFSVLFIPLITWAILEYVSAWLSRRVTHAARQASRLMLTGNIINKPGHYFNDWASGRSPRGIDSAVGAASFAVRSILQDMVVTLPRLLSPYIAITLLVLTMSVAVAASFICWLVVFLAVSFWMARRHASAFDLAALHSQRVAANSIDLYQNNVLLKQHQTGKSEYQGMASLLDEDNILYSRTQSQLDGAAMWQRALILVAMATMMLSGISLIGSAGVQAHAYETGELLALLMLMIFAAMRMDGVGRMLINVREQKVRLRQAIQMLDWDRRRRGGHVSDMTDTLHGYSLSLFKLRTRLSDEAAAGAGADMSSGGISLTINEGESVGIVGLSGAGKSLLARSMAGYVPARAGQVMLGRVDIQRISEACLHQTVRLLSHDAPVLQRSLRDNLLYGFGPEEKTDGQLNSAIAFAGLEPVIARIGGLHSVIGDPLHTFSLAERQRINLARVWMSTVRILILDCAMSALDSQQELEMQRRIARRFQGCTVITISQRPQLLEQTDRLLFVEENEIIEDMKKSSIGYDFSRVSKFVSDGPRQTVSTDDPFPVLFTGQENVTCPQPTDVGPAQPR